MPVLPDEGDNVADDIAAAFESVEAPAAAPAEIAPAPSDGGRPRDEVGRFAKTNEAPQERQEAAPADITPPAAEQQPQEAAPAAAPGGPPPGWSPTAKALWHEGKLPPEIVQAVQKREEEVNKGLAKLQEYKGLDPYVQMAQSAGTTVTAALDNYIRAEQRLEKDPVGGIRWLCQQYGVDPAQLAGQPARPPEGQQPGEQVYPPLRPETLAPYLSPLLSPLQQQLAELRNSYYGEKQAVTQSSVEAFFSDPANRYAENVADQMVTFLQSGIVDKTKPNALQEAYQQACWSNPEIRGLLIKEQEAKSAAEKAAKAKAAADQARAAGRSVTSTPNAGAPPPQRADHEDLRAQIAEAFEARL
jgi:hypothetical protein